MIQFVSNKVFFLRLAWIQPRSATDRTGQRYIPVYTMDQMFSVCSRNLNWPRTKGQRDRQREIERERCPLLKLRYTRQGHPSLQLQTQPPTAKITDIISNKMIVLQTAIFNNTENHEWLHKTQYSQVSTRRRSRDEGVPSGGWGLACYVTDQVWWNQVPQPSGTSGLRGKRPGDHHPRSRAGFLTSGV